MNQVLSQSEVDALLSAVSEGELGENEGGQDANSQEDDRVVVV